jgi:hypothetical protein
MEAIYAALGGLQRSMDQVDRTSSALSRAPMSAEPPRDEVSLSDAAFALLTARNSFDANLDSLKFAGQMLDQALGRQPPCVAAGTRR